MSDLELRTQFERILESSAVGVSDLNETPNDKRIVEPRYAGAASATSEVEPDSNTTAPHSFRRLWRWLIGIGLAGALFMYWNHRREGPTGAGPLSNDDKNAFSSLSQNDDSPDPLFQPFHDERV